MTLEHVTDRPHVVVENPRRSAGFAQTEALEAAGYDVTYCPGPSALASGMCPAVDGVGCPLVAGADAVLCDLDLDDPHSREVLTRLRHDYPDTQIVVEVPADVVRENPTLLQGCHVVVPYDMERLVAAIGDALAHPVAHGPAPTPTPA